jgi:hypothetical protein
MLLADHIKAWERLRTSRTTRPRNDLTACPATFDSAVITVNGSLRIHLAPTMGRIRFECLASAAVDPVSHLHVTELGLTAPLWREVCALELSADRRRVLASADWYDPRPRDELSAEPDEDVEGEAEGMGLTVPDRSKAERVGESLTADDGACVYADVHIVSGRSCRAAEAIKVTSGGDLLDGEHSACAWQHCGVRVNDTGVGQLDPPRFEDPIQEYEYEQLAPAGALLGQPFPRALTVDVTV